MKTSVIKDTLLAAGYALGSQRDYYFKFIPDHLVYKSVDLYPREIIYRLFDDVDYNSLIFITSKPKDFSKTLEDFERQCDILLTTILFSKHEN
jgi:hypothetical protein